MSPCSPISRKACCFLFAAGDIGNITNGEQTPAVCSACIFYEGRTALWFWCVVACETSPTTPSFPLWDPMQFLRCTHSRLKPLQLPADSLSLFSVILLSLSFLPGYRRFTWIRDCCLARPSSANGIICIQTVLISTSPDPVFHKKLIFISSAILFSFHPASFFVGQGHVCVSPSVFSPSLHT